LRSVLGQPIVTYFLSIIRDVAPKNSCGTLSVLDRGLFINSPVAELSEMHDGKQRFRWK
jgi:hypothetical protein